MSTKIKIKIKWNGENLSMSKKMNIFMKHGTMEETTESNIIQESGMESNEKIQNMRGIQHKIGQVMKRR